MADGDWRLIPGPGSGVLARFGPTVLLLERAGDPAAQELIDAARDVAPDAVIDALFQVLRKRGSAQVTAFCALVESGGQWTLAIHGEMKAVAFVKGSPVRYAGRGAGARVEETIPADATQVGAGGRQPDPASSALLDLRAGVVPAGSFVLALAGAAAPELLPEDAPVPEVAPVPAAAAAADSDVTRHLAEAVAVEAAPAPPPAHEPTIAAAPEVDVREALTAAYQAISAAPEHAQPPDVQGRLCEMGHLNHPAATQCWICGAATTGQPGTGPRPPLGRLTTKDNRSFIVDGDFVIGRRPEQSEDVAAGRARPISAPLEQTSVSRVHAEIRVRDWDVLLVDLGSANGSYYLPPGGQWIRVQPQEPVVLTKGTSITLAGFEMLLESV